MCAVTKDWMPTGLGIDASNEKNEFFCQQHARMHIVHIGRQSSGHGTFMSYTVYIAKLVHHVHSTTENAHKHACK